VIARQRKHTERSAPMQSSDEFAGSSSGYDPDRAWFLSHDTSPPYESTNLRLTFPVSELQAIKRFILDEPERTFVSVQQVLRNAIHHGFHHMQEVQRFTGVENVARLNLEHLKREELHAELLEKKTTLEEVHQMREDSQSPTDTQKVRDYVEELVTAETDEYYIKELRAVVQKY